MNDENGQVEHKKNAICIHGDNSADAAEVDSRPSPPTTQITMQLTLRGGRVHRTTAEEDDGVLWKHKGSKSGEFAMQTDMRRGTKLVISSMSTIGNCERGPLLATVALPAHCAVSLTRWPLPAADEYGYYWYISVRGLMEIRLRGLPPEINKLSAAAYGHACRAD